GHAAGAQRLEARLGAPFRADPELQARAQRVADVHALAAAGALTLAEAAVQHQERLAADLPSRRQAGAGQRIARVVGTKLEIVERHAQVRDEFALQLS